MSDYVYEGEFEDEEDPRAADEIYADLDDWDPEDELDRDFYETFMQTAKRAEKQQGKPLLESQIERLWDEAAYRDDPRHLEEGVVLDLGRRRDRVEYMDRLFGEHQAAQEPERPDVIERPGPDASKEERIAYINARHAGAETADTTEGDE